MKTRTKVAIIAGIGGLLTTTAILMTSSPSTEASAPDAVQKPASEPEPELGSIEKGSTLVTMQQWTTVEVANKSPIRGFDGRTLMKGDTCWTSKDTRVKVLAVSDNVGDPYSGEQEWALVAIFQQGGLRNLHGEGNTCPVGTVFFMDGYLARQSAQYGASRLKREQEKKGREAEASHALEEYERQHR